MKVKQFRGRNLAEAISKARSACGEDLILLESREKKAGNNGRTQKMVEVSVSYDEKNDKSVKPWTPPHIKRTVEQNQPEDVVIENTNNNQPNDFNSVISDILARKPREMGQEKQILQELSALRRQLDDLKMESKNQHDESALPQAFENLLNLMQDKGMKDEIAGQLIKRVYQLLPNPKSATTKRVANSLKKELGLKFSAFDHRKFQNKNDKQTVMLVGPSGVGKTVSAMKLAAHPEIFGKRDVAIVSTDLYGPSEALKAFSKMSGTAVYERKQMDELKAVMNQFKRNEVVIVDTPGQSPFTPNYLNRLEDFIKVVQPTDIFLVLSMSTDLKDLFLAAALYLLIKPTGIILTKFDETAQPAKVFTILEELNIPIVAFCEGKRIFIDIALPNEDYVLNKIFEQV